MARNKLLLAFLCAIVALSDADISKRKLKIELYPDCHLYKSCRDKLAQNATAANASFPNVVYIRAAANDDILHFVLTTIHLPSVLAVHTVGSPDAHLNFSWDHLLLANNLTDIAGGINATGGGDIKYSYSLIFSRLIEYNDINDNAQLTSVDQSKEDLWNIRDFTEFEWMNVTLGETGNSIIFNSSRPQLAPYQNSTRGYVMFEFKINADGGRDDDLPRLMYTANNTQMDFVLDKYVPKFNKSRFALEMTIIANHSSKSMEVDETESIDDEYTPGVFRIVNWYTRGDNGETCYVQWKPVCYLDSHRARDVGTEVTIYDLQEPSKVKSLESLLELSLAKAFFGDTMNESSLVMQMSTNVSFGLSQDGYYLKNNYTVWTASIGYGTAPIDAISLLVIVIIAAGLGIPFVIMVFGGIYVGLRKRRKSSYEQIGDSVTNNYTRVN